MLRSWLLLFVLCPCVSISALAVRPALADTAVLADWTPRAADLVRLGDVYHFQQFTFRPPTGWSGTVTNSVDYASPRLRLIGPTEANGASPSLCLMWLRPAKADDTPSAADKTLDDTIGYFKAALHNTVAGEVQRGVVNGRLFVRAGFHAMTTRYGSPVAVDGFAYVGRIPVAAGSDIIVAYGYDGEPSATDTLPLMESAVETLRDTGVESDVREPFDADDKAVDASSASVTIGPFTVHISPDFRPKGDNAALVSGKLKQGQSVFVGPQRKNGSSARLVITAAPAKVGDVATRQAQSDTAQMEGILMAIGAQKSDGATCDTTEIEHGLINGVAFDRAYFARMVKGKAITHGFAYSGCARGWVLTILGDDPGAFPSANLADAESVALTARVTK